MAERRAGAKGRRLGSSRRKQLREALGEDAAAAASVPGAEEEPPPAADTAQKVQDFFQACDREQKGFVTRADVQKLRAEDFPCSAEELELIFDGLDADGTGRLTSEELAAGLGQLVSSQRATRDHRRRKTASRRDRLVPGGPVLEEADSEERKHFAAFVDQLGTDNVFEDQEIWQLWVRLRQDEPPLLGNLEDFLAKMRRRIQEAKSEKEALEVILDKRVAEHNREVQQLCEALEQQMRQETQRLEQESEARSHQHGAELWQALAARETQMQRLVSAQTELEARCRSLRSSREAAGTENRRLERSNRALEERLRHVRLQLRDTQGRLRAAKAATARDGPAAELPGETQTSPEQEKHRSEMRIRLGSQSSDWTLKSSHHVVWEKAPAEITVSGSLPGAISVEEDPFPEFLKEEHFSDQSSLLREMNDAIAALSKELKPQGPGDPVPAGDVPLRPREDATAHGAAPGAPRETLAGLRGQEQGDLLQEGPARAALGAGDVTPAGASESAGHRTAQERGGEQGRSPGRAGQGPEDARRLFFVQGQGTATAGQMLEEAEDVQGAQGESTEVGAQALTEVEEAGFTQGKTGWEAAQPPGDAEKAALTQGENSDADAGPAEPRGLELVLGERCTAEVLCRAAAQGERVQHPRDGAELGDKADSHARCSEKLDPEAQSLGEAGRPGVVPGESRDAGLQPPAAGRDVEAEQAGSGDAGGLDAAQTPQLAPAEARSVAPAAQAGTQEAKPGESSEAAARPPAEAEAGEVARSAGAEPQPGGESAAGDAAPGGRGDAGLRPGDEAEQLDVAQGGSTGLAEPLDVMQEEGAGADVQPGEEAKSAGGLEGRSSDTSVQSLAEAEELESTPGKSAGAELQPPSEAGSPGTKQGGSGAPHVQPPDEADETKPELQEGSAAAAAAAAVPFESPCAAETPVGSSGPDVLLPVTAQGLEMVEAEEVEAEMQLWGVPSPESPQGAEGRAAAPLQDEAVHGGLGEGERVLLREPEVDPHGVGVGVAADVMQEEGAGADVQPGEEAKSAGGLEGQSSDTSVQSLAEAEELKSTPGKSAGAELQPPSEAGSPGTKQGGSGAPHVQPPDEADETKPELQEGSAAAAAAAAAVPFESPSAAETPVGSSGPDVLLPVTAQGLEMVEAEEVEAETWVQGVPSPESPQGAESCAAEELEFTLGESTEAELQPPSKAGSPDPFGMGVGLGEGTAPEEAESLGAREAPSPEVEMLWLTEVEEPKFTLSESMVAGLGPLGAAQTWEEMPGQMVALEARVVPQGDVLDGVASAARGAQPRDKATADTETPDLEMMLGELAGAEGQILEESQTLEITQGEKVDARSQSEERAQKLEVMQAEMIHPEFSPQALGASNGEKTQGKNADLEVYSLETPKAEEMQGDKASRDVLEEPEEVMLGDRADPALYSFKIHGVETLQGERTDAEVKPLDGAQDLEVAQGGSLEADEGFLARTEGLQPKQGRDAGAATLASPVSEVPLPIRGQRQETLMQEDVLVPDLQRLGISGQEQVSTQADKVRPDVAPEQLLPKEKPLWVTEAEQIAAECTEPPKEEVPPASTLRASVQLEEHAGSNLAGTLLADSLLRDVANSGMQPPAWLSEDARSAPDVGQWDGKQDVRPSPGDPGAVSADGAGTAPRGSPETCRDPDHLYNVLFVGDSHVGKTSFLYRLQANSFNPHLTATVGLDYQIKNLIVDNKLFALRLWDSAGQERYHSITKQFFRKADGVVLMYDITSEYSFADVRYWLSCIQEGAEDGVAILLLGNKTDCAAERRVPTKEGERLAQEHQLMFYECSAASGHNVSESMVSLVRLLKIREDQLKNKVEEEPKPTQKKKGCC